MSIKLEYIVCNKKGDELKRFDIKSEAEAFDSVICAAEDISLLLEPLQKEISLTEDQIYAISEHLAFQSDEIKLALKQIKKPKSVINTKNKSKNNENPEELAEILPLKKKSSAK